MQLNVARDRETRQRELDQAFLELAKASSTWEGSLQEVFKRFTETVADAVGVGRVSIWRIEGEAGRMRCLDLHVHGDRSHTAGAELSCQDYPAYFNALDQARMIDASDAHTDPRTREFSESYLRPLGIGAMLDATLRKAGASWGVICLEHLGTRRIWNAEEKGFAISVADLLNQLVAHDETRRRESELAKVNAMQRAILHGAKYSVISTDPDGVIRSANPSSERIFGYTTEELIGANLYLLHDPDDISARAAKLKINGGGGFEVIVHEARNGSSEERRWACVGKDGRSIPIRMSVTSLTDEAGQLGGFLAIACDITDQVASERAQLENQRRYHALFEGSGDSIFVLRGDRFVDCNAATLSMFGCAREQILGQPPYRFSPEMQPDGGTSLERARERIQAALRGESQRFEWEHIRCDGAPFDAEVTLNRVLIGGEPHLIAAVRDISQRKRAEKALAQSRGALLERNESLRLINQLAIRLHEAPTVPAILERTLDVLLGTIGTARVLIYLYCAENGELRVAASRASGMPSRPETSGDGILLKGSLSGLALSRRDLVVSDDWGEDQQPLAELGTGSEKQPPVTGAAIPLIFNGQILGAIELAYQIRRTFGAALKETFRAIGKTVSAALANARHVEDMEYLVHHDSLTGLPNRLRLHEELGRLFEQGMDEAALMLLDLDRFKEVNDALGHHVGDEVLRRIGPRLESVTGGGRALVCRLGGDEFAILFPGVGRVEEALSFARRLLSALSSPIEVESMRLEMDGSIGIALYPTDGGDSHALLRSADVAMYESKSKGGGIAFYNPDLDTHTPERLALIADLSTALRERQLVLHYQPKLDLASGEIAGFEVLVRWHHPRLGLLAPDAFLPLAEMSESIHALTEQIVERALAQARRWRRAGRPSGIAVNLSARNLVDDRCAIRIRELLVEYETGPGELELEITETALMHDPAGAARLLEGLAQAGVTIAIDDFGTGYSSLAYIRKLPIHALKIDRLFISAMGHSEHDAIIVRSTVALAHNLGLKVVAEGVESEETMQSLRDVGCDVVQGYHVTPPLSVKELEAWLDERCRWRATD